ncbi:MAG: hypothetical protein K2W94_00815 [Alphaproteobacteria bacterium]|nr:hypothetical protein [Alphaproteobacteria bacterium]
MYSLIISVFVVFISWPVMAMKPMAPSHEIIDYLYGKSDHDITSFRGENGETIFHHLFRQFKISGSNKALNDQIQDYISRFPELLLEPDNDGDFATDLVEGSLLPINVYEVLAKKFKVSLYNPETNTIKEKFMEDIAPSLLATVAQKLRFDEQAEKIYYAFVLNGSRGLLRVQLKGMGIPLFMVPVNAQVYYYIVDCFKKETSALGGFINALTKTPNEDPIDEKAIKFIKAGERGIFHVFQRDTLFNDFFGYADNDTYKTDKETDPDYQDPIFLDAILFSMTQADYIRKSKELVISKQQFDKLLRIYPHLAEKIKQFPKPFEKELEYYFDENMKRQRIHTLLSRPAKKLETNPVKFVSTLVLNGSFTLPDYLSEFKTTGKKLTFTDYFRIVSTQDQHGTIDSNFWDYLYNNQNFRNKREYSAAQAFLIGLNISSHNKHNSHSWELEVFKPDVIKALLKKDNEFRGQEEKSSRLPAAIRTINLITRANHFIDQKDILDLDAQREIANDAGLEILNGSNPFYKVNTKRKATKDEFLAVMNFLRATIKKPEQQVETALTESTIIPDLILLREKIMGDLENRDRQEDSPLLRRHRQNLTLCALWLALEDSKPRTAKSEAQKIKVISSAFNDLSVEEIENRLYKMEGNFAIPRYFIRSDKRSLENELK